MPFEKGDAAIHEHVVEVMNRFHHGLRDVGVRVDCVWARAKTDDNGDPVGAPLKLHGYPCAAVVRVLSQKDRAMGRGDAEITFDGDKWIERSPAEQDAIIDHELLHLELVCDGEGEVKRDDGGRPRLKLKLHDIEVGWFLAIAARHREASLEVQQAEQIFLKNEQLLFPFAARTPAKKAVEFFDADKGDVKSVLVDAAKDRGVALSNEDFDKLAQCITEGMSAKGMKVEVKRAGARTQARFGMPGFMGASKGKMIATAGEAVAVNDAVEVFFDESVLQEVLRRRTPTTWFWCDMTDMFGAWVPDAWIDRCFATAAATPWHTHQFLTKRTDRMAEYLASRAPRKEGEVSVQIVKLLNEMRPELGGRNWTSVYVPDGHRQRWPIPNLWLGCSAGNQKTYDERVEFLSLEPLIGPIDLTRQIHDGVRPGVDIDIDGGAWPGGREPFVEKPIHWVIAGGETEVQAAGVAFFFKQHGEWKSIRDTPEAEYQRYYRSNRKAMDHEDQAAIDESYGRRCTIPVEVVRYDGKHGPITQANFTSIDGHNSYQTFRMGKKAAGRLLDGRTWDEMPAVYPVAGAAKR